jgi:hypothetical protein
MYSTVANTGVSQVYSEWWLGSLMGGDNSGDTEFDWKIILRSYVM